MVWIDQRDVAAQHLALAREAIERASAAGADLSPDLVTALEELHAASAALERVAGGAGDGDLRPADQNGGGSESR